MLTLAGLAGVATALVRIAWDCARLVALPPTIVATAGEGGRVIGRWHMPRLGVLRALWQAQRGLRIEVSR
jgi:hypothetical protein